MNGACRKTLRFCFSVALTGLLFFHVPPARAADVSSVVSIRASGMIFNRTTNTYDSNVSITNIGQAPLRKPFQLIVTLTPAGVSVANKTGTTTQGKAYIEVAHASELLNQGQTITAQLKLSNPSQLKFSAAFALDAEVAQSGNLPPDPGEAGKATVAGIDSNQDGVRDDVERFIALNYPDSQRHRQALAQLARTVLAELVAPTKESAVQLANQGVRDVECLAFAGFLNDGSIEDLLIAIINTKERILAMEAHNERINGQVFTAVDTSEQKSACKFDIDSLKN